MNEIIAVASLLVVLALAGAEDRPAKWSAAPACRLAAISVLNPSC